MPYCIAVTGGGSNVISSLQTIPGASQAFLEGVVPYHQNALVKYLGCTPGKFCSSNTARMMAMRAFENAKNYAKLNSVVGIACTASLASSEPKKGDHRFHIAYHNENNNFCRTVTLKKDVRHRIEEELILGIELLILLARAVGIENNELESRLFDTEIESIVDAETPDVPENWKQLVRGDINVIPYRCEIGEFQNVVARNKSTDPFTFDGILPCALLSGAFNPLHNGHREMKRVAEAILGCPVAYELSILNVDKASLGYLDLSERFTQFDPKDEVVFTRLPRFVDKACEFNNTCFVVGLDTWLRIGLRPTWNEEMKSLVEAGAMFLVFGRYNMGSEKFEVMSDYKDKVPSVLYDMSREVPESKFRADLSSSQIRQVQS